MSYYLSNMRTYLIVCILGFCLTSIEPLYALGICIGGLFLSMMIIITFARAVGWLLKRFVGEDL